MPRASEYSSYTLHMCSHMRLVVWGRNCTDGGQVIGWYHVGPDGTLENFGQPCQASIHRFDMEWPDDCTNLNHMLASRSESGSLDVSPSDKALYQLDAEQNSR